MTDYYPDFEQSRPTGEASRIPDERLSECGDGEPRRQRVATSRTGYPDESAEKNSECRSCGAPIPATQTKCQFCLTNHLDGSPSEGDGVATERTFVGIVHLVVESTTFYGAVAKGSAACSLLAQNNDESTVDECELIYDLDEDPADVLTRRWGELSAAVRIPSDRGQQLLETARGRTRWMDDTAGCDDEHATALYDESGSGIRDRRHLETLLEGGDRDLWLVPAIALREDTEPSRRAATERVRRTPTRRSLHCWACDRDTAHSFLDYERGPPEDWAGQPMWECRICGTPRHGPRPDSDR
jgi:hypothetical protein